MSQKTRILLKHNNKLKKFIFVIVSKRGSIYFGSSLPKPKEMKIGVIQIPEGNNGNLRIYTKNAKSIPPKIGKFSYHPSNNWPSAIIHLKTEDDDSLYEYEVSEMKDMTDYRKLFIVIPQNPATFPLFEKKKSENDIVIPTDSFKGKAFCVNVFFSKKNYDWRQVSDQDAINSRVVMKEILDYLLIIELFQKEQFLKKDWPKYFSIIPYIDGADIDITKIWN